MLPVAEPLGRYATATLAPPKGSGCILDIVAWLTPRSACVAPVIHGCLSGSADQRRQRQYGAQVVFAFREKGRACYASTNPVARSRNCDASPRFVSEAPLLRPGLPQQRGTNMLSESF